MLKQIDADIMSVTTGNIFQQVNCQGVMRSGLAKTIKEKHPCVEREYLDYCGHVPNPLDRIGSVLKVDINMNLSVINIFGQLGYSTPEERHAAGKTIIRHTEYAALKQAFAYVVKSDLLHSNNLVCFPYLFGCNRGGGDWGIVQELIERYFPHAVIYKLPE